MVVATTSCAQHGPGSQAPSEACQSLADPLLRRQSSSSKEELWPAHGQQQLDGPRHFCLGVYGSKVRAVDDNLLVELCLLLREGCHQVPPAAFQELPCKTQLQLRTCECVQVLSPSSEARLGPPGLASGMLALCAL